MIKLDDYLDDKSFLDDEIKFHWALQIQQSRMLFIGQVDEITSVLKRGQRINQYHYEEFLSYLFQGRYALAAKKLKYIRKIKESKRPVVYTDAMSSMLADKYFTKEFFYSIANKEFHTTQI